eukprot:1806969-Amphidinium_carterae.1
MSMGTVVCVVSIVATLASCVHGGVVSWCDGCACCFCVGARLVLLPLGLPGPLFFFVRLLLSCGVLRVEVSSVSQWSVSSKGRHRVIEACTESL